MSSTNLVSQTLFVFHSIFFLLITLIIFLIPVYDFFSLPQTLAPLFYEPDQIPEIIYLGVSEIISLIICFLVYNYSNPLLKKYINNENDQIEPDIIQTKTHYGETITQGLVDNSYIEPTNKQADIQVLRIKDLLVINWLYLLVPFLGIIELLRSVFSNQTYIDYFIAGLILLMISWAFLIFLIPIRHFERISKLIKQKSKNPLPIKDT